MEYFNNRQNPTKATKSELEEIFKCIAENFSYKWLKMVHGSHPLQQLWNRKDAMSTNELYFFGSCLKSLLSVDANWVKQQVSLIKNGQINNRQGAFFEINALGMLLSKDQIVRPARGNNPGFDGVLSISDLKSMRISLKNYGDSSHYKDCVDNASKFEIALKEVLKEKNTHPLQIIIHSPTNAFPSKSNWQDLTNSLPQILENITLGEAKSFGISDFWLFMYRDLKKDEHQEFHTSFNSYILIISIPYHKNEEKNLLDKLDEACYNLTKHANWESDDVINAIFVHIPESASIKKCNEWAEDYLINYPEKPITMIILYQPTVATNIEKDTSFIHHCFKFAVRRDKFAKWNTLNKTIDLNLPIGVISEEPIQNKIIAEFNEKIDVVDLGDLYIYQRGNIYIKGNSAADGYQVGNVQRIASGVFSHSIIQLFPDQPALMFSGHYAPIDKLIIL